MNNKFKSLTNELSEKLIKESYLFLFDRLGNNEENTGDIIDFILSTHLTCAFQLMKSISEGNKEIEEKVSEFINSIIDYISKLGMISNVQFMENN